MSNRSNAALHRRPYLAAVAATAAVGVSGCLGFRAGEETLKFEASGARAADDAVSESGYEFAGRQELVVERTFEVGDQRREVAVTNWRTEYEKSVGAKPIGVQQSAVFAILTTPQVTVLGREFNPVADMSTEELAEMVQGQYDGISDPRHLSDHDITVNGETTTESVFEADATVAGQVFQIRLHLTEAVELGNDLVLAIGGYPAVTPAEEAHIRELITSIEQES